MENTKERKSRATCLCAYFAQVIRAKNIETDKEQQREGKNFAHYRKKRVVGASPLWNNKHKFYHSLALVHVR